jgi:hypothetical protein
MGNGCRPGAGHHVLGRGISFSGFDLMAVTRDEKGRPIIQWDGVNWWPKPPFTGSDVIQIIRERDLCRTPTSK